MSTTRLATVRGLLPLGLIACSPAVPGKGDGGSGGGVNSPPSAPTVALSPSPATAADTLSVVMVAEATDPDGDLVTYRYVWFADGAIQPELTGAALPAGTTAKGQRWTVNVVATDGVADGGVATAESEIINTPPTVTVTLPSRAQSGEDLVVEVAVTDADDDPVSLSFSWAADGITAPWAEGTVPASATTRGQLWTVTVTPDDGEATGEPVSASVEIENGRPEVGEIELSPAVVFTDDVLTASTAAIDPDGDTAWLSYAWSVNGAPIDATGPRLNGLTSFEKGDSLQVTVTATDDEGAGPIRTSAVVIVQNSPPSAPLIQIEPTHPAADEALSCAVLTESIDADGDPILYTFTWDADGVPSTAAVDDVYAGDRVPPGVTASGEEWTCSVDATDGEASSTVAVDVVTIGGACGDGAVTLSASGVDFVTVCAGSFDMGCTPGQPSCAADESPVRTVTLTQDYYLARTEVTQAQFAALMGYDGSRDTTCGADCPVEQVTWHEAAAFTNAMSAAAGLSPCYTCTGAGSTVACVPVSTAYSCDGYRLPTEAEWEGAARCGEDLPYAGDVDYWTVAWTYVNSYAKQPVASKLPNLCGLYDMSGNIGEWTEDRYGPYPSTDEVDPVGPRVGSQVVNRGGSWGTAVNGCRVAYRNEWYGTAGTEYVGFRVARTRP